LRISAEELRDGSFVKSHSLRLRGACGEGGRAIPCGGNPFRTVPNGEAR
jgi:hypothetical protein